MAKFKLVGGQHDHYGKMYVKDDIIEVDYDITAQFPGKFVQVHTNEPITEAPDMPDDIVSVNTNPPEPKTEQADRGKNVTAKFPIAVDNQYLVFTHKRRHWVYDPDAMAAPLNKDGLLKHQVEEFIGKHLEE